MPGTEYRWRYRLSGSGRIRRYGGNSSVSSGQTRPPDRGANRRQRRKCAEARTHFGGEDGQGPDRDFGCGGDQDTKSEGRPKCLKRFSWRTTVLTALRRSRRFRTALRSGGGEIRSRTPGPGRLSRKAPGTRPRPPRRDRRNVQALRPILSTSVERTSNSLRYELTRRRSCVRTALRRLQSRSPRSHNPKAASRKTGRLPRLPPPFPIAPADTSTLPLPASPAALRS